MGVVSQKVENKENPGLEDINTIGTVAQILKVLKMPDGNTTVIIQGKKRFELAELVSTEPYLTATIKEVAEARPAHDDKEFEAVIDSIKELATDIIKDSPNIPSEAAFAIKNIESNIAKIEKEIKKFNELLSEVNKENINDQIDYNDYNRLNDLLNIQLENWEKNQIEINKITKN